MPVNPAWCCPRLRQRALLARVLGAHPHDPSLHEWRQSELAPLLVWDANHRHAATSSGASSGEDWVITGEVSVWAKTMLS